MNSLVGTYAFLGGGGGGGVEGLGNGCWHGWSLYCCCETVRGNVKA